jgi:phage anti-repressor protein
LGHNYSCSYNDNSSISYTFFRAWLRRPKIKVFAATRDGSVGFQVIVRRSGIHNPYVECNGIEYSFEKRFFVEEKGFLHENVPYSFYPFKIQQDQYVGAYIFQLHWKLGVVKNFDTTIRASIRIRGDGFKMEKDYIVRTNLSELRTKRLNPNEVIDAKDVRLSLEEIKEPSLWRRFLSSFSVTRSRIPK